MEEVHSVLHLSSFPQPLSLSLGPVSCDARLVVVLLPLFILSEPCRCPVFRSKGSRRTPVTYQSCCSLKIVSSQTLGTPFELALHRCFTRKKHLRHSSCAHRQALIIAGPHRPRIEIITITSMDERDNVTHIRSKTLRSRRAELRSGDEFFYGFFS